MGKKQRQRRAAGLRRMRAYVAQLQPLMRLSHWDISVSEGPARDTAEASIWHSKNCHIAVVYFADKHLAQSPQEQAVTVAHELLHLHLADLDYAAQEGIASLGPLSKPYVEERYTVAMERAVDALSRVLAPFLPLPPSEEERAA